MTVPSPAFATQIAVPSKATAAGRSPTGIGAPCRAARTRDACAPPLSRGAGVRGPGAGAASGRRQPRVRQGPQRLAREPRRIGPVPGHPGRHGGRAVRDAVAVRRRDGGGDPRDPRHREPAEQRERERLGGRVLRRPRAAPPPCRRRGLGQAGPSVSRIRGSRGGRPTPARRGSGGWPSAWSGSCWCGAARWSARTSCSTRSGPAGRRSPPGRACAWRSRAHGRCWPSRAPAA